MRAAMMSLALALSACGGSGPTGTTGELVLPTCGPGSLLSTDDAGTPVCLSLPITDAFLPTCPAGQALGAAGPSLGCTSVYDGAAAQAMARIAALEAQLQPVLAQLQVLMPSAPGFGKLVGTGAQSYKGRIAPAGAAAGLSGAIRDCGTKYGAGAHMCTAREVYLTILGGSLNAATRFAKSWIYMPAGNRPLPGAAFPDAGLADTCGGYTTEGNNWAGVAMEWTVLPTGDVGLKLHGGSAAPCDQPLPIACCK